MYSSQSSHHKHRQFSELPTAAKSHHHQPSSPYHQHLYNSTRTPSRYVSKFRNIKSSLNEIIDDISEKKSTANSAVGRVQQVNEEAMQIFSKDMWTPRKTPSIMKKSSRTDAFKSQEKTRGFNTPNDFMYQSGQGVTQVSLQNENVQLKRSLNDKLRENNELLREIGMLREENQALQMGSQKGVPHYILKELEDLKRQNEKLRQETIHLLQRKSHY